MLRMGQLACTRETWQNGWKMRSLNDQHQNAHAAQLSNIIMIMYFSALSHFPFLTSDLIRLHYHHVRAPTAGCSATLMFYHVWWGLACFNIAPQPHITSGREISSSRSLRRDGPRGTSARGYGGALPGLLAPYGHAVSHVSDSRSKS